MTEIHQALGKEETKAILHKRWKKFKNKKTTQNACFKWQNEYREDREEKDCSSQ